MKAKLNNKIKGDCAMNYKYNRDKIVSLGDTQILGLGEIIRYNNRAKIKHENVAEHSFYVSTTVLKICEIYEIDDITKLEALEFAAVHDIPELLIGDIPHDTKVNNPELAVAIEEAELTALKQSIPEYTDLYKKFLAGEKNQTVSYLIIKLADTASVLQYSNQEIDLGNTTQDMKEINSDAVYRVNNLINRLEEALKENSD